MRLKRIEKAPQRMLASVALPHQVRIDRVNGGTSISMIYCLAYVKPRCCATAISELPDGVCAAPETK